MKIKPIPNTAVSTPTRYYYNKLMKFLEQDDEWRWSEVRVKPTQRDYWVDYKKETCINVSEKTIYYSDKYWFKKEDYTIISVNEFIKRSTEVPVFKVITKSKGDEERAKLTGKLLKKIYSKPDWVDNLKEGDVLVDEDGYKFTLNRKFESYELVYKNGSFSLEKNQIREQLKPYTKPTKTKITRSEIAERFGIDDVTKLQITRG